MNRFIKITLIVLLIGMIGTMASCVVMGILASRQNTQATKPVELPDLLTAPYMLTVENTHNVLLAQYYTDDGEQIIATNLWEYGKGKWISRPGTWYLPRGKWGPITITRRKE